MILSIVCFLFPSIFRQSKHIFAKNTNQKFEKIQTPKKKTMYLACSMYVNT